MMTPDTFIFVFAKNSETRFLKTGQEAEMDALQNDGWKHAATLNRAIWIEALVDGYNADELINELQSPTPEAYLRTIGKWEEVQP